MGRNLVNIDRATPMLLAEDLREWLPADDVAHLVIEAVEGMDLSLARVNERGSGSAQYPPGMLLALLIYCYSQGLYSSRRMERATHTHVGVRYVTANTHPDHDTIAAFRRTHGELLQRAFVEVLQLARELGVPRLGTVCLDGTKLSANASKRASRSEAQLKAEVQARLAAAEKTDAEETTTEQLPSALTDRRTRLARLQAARATLAARAEAQGRPPDDTDSGNPTDPDSRLMPTAQGPFVQGYNAQLAVAAESGLIVAAHVCTETQDRRQLAPTVAAIPPEAGRPQTIVADAGYDNSAQVATVAAQTGATVYIPAPQLGRRAGRQSYARAQAHAERTARQRRVESPLGRHWQRLRQRVVEPVFGIFKHNWRFTRFQLRGLAGVNTEWLLLCTAYNLRKLARWWQAQPA